jgi:hypothetical protein
VIGSQTKNSVDVSYGQFAAFAAGTDGEASEPNPLVLADAAAPEYVAIPLDDIWLSAASTSTVGVVGFESQPARRITAAAAGRARK